MCKTCNRAYTYDIIDYLYRHFAVSENSVKWPFPKSNKKYILI